ncbi:MAG: alpha/beta hydrolase, partial [Planktomarina sp.]
MRWTILFLFLATALPAQDIDIFADGEHGQLAGSYRNQGRHAPLVLIIPGSGPIDRNGLRVGVPGIGVYQRLADELEANNISSVRIDKRGGFASIDAIIDSDDFRISGYADDARAWVTRMQMLTDNCIWVFGHSEGGLVASVMVADDQSGICGLILAAAPGRPIDQVLYDQLTRYTKSNRVLGMIRNTLAQLKSGQEANPKTLPLLLRHLFTPTNQRYFIDWMTYDPAHVLA